MISRTKPRLIWGCLRSSRPIIKKGREDKGAYSLYQQREHRQSRQTHAQKHTHAEPKCGTQNPQNHARTTKQKHITLIYYYTQPQAGASPSKNTTGHAKPQNSRSNPSQEKNQQNYIGKPGCTAIHLKRQQYIPRAIHTLQYTKTVRNTYP